MSELANENTKAIISLPDVQEVKQWHRRHKEDPIQTSISETYNIWDENKLGGLTADYTLRKK